VGVGAVAEVLEDVRRVGERCLAPTHGAPSPPMWVKVLALHPTCAVWQPMPAIAIEPSGTLVELLCGQPEQK
jgi:hypothetical protein